MDGLTGVRPQGSVHYSKVDSDGGGREGGRRRARMIEMACQMPTRERVGGKGGMGEAVEEKREEGGEGERAGRRRHQAQAEIGTGTGTGTETETGKETETGTGKETETETETETEKGTGTGAAGLHTAFEGGYLRRNHAFFKHPHVLHCLEGALKTASPSLGAPSITDAFLPFCSGREGLDLVPTAIRALSVCITSLRRDSISGTGGSISSVSGVFDILLAALDHLDTDAESSGGAWSGVKDEGMVYGVRDACCALEAIGDVCEWLGSGSKKVLIVYHTLPLDQKLSLSPYSSSLFFLFSSSLSHSFSPSVCLSSSLSLSLSLPLPLPLPLPLFLSTSLIYSYILALSLTTHLILFLFHLFLVNQVMLRVIYPLLATAAHTNVCVGDAALRYISRPINPTPHTPHPTPHTPHPTPYTPHPTPYTLHPN